MPGGNDNSIPHERGSSSMVAQILGYVDYIINEFL